MSDFPGEITKQSLSAPPMTNRSTRYSLTARGRSRSPSRRLPTGSSSFENASGCMRLPWPAAGMIPHMVPHDLDELGGAHLRAVMRECALARAARDPAPDLGIEVQRRDGVGGVPRNDDFGAGLEEGIEPFPPVGHDGR